MCEVKVGWEGCVEGSESADLKYLIIGTFKRLRKTSGKVYIAEIFIEGEREKKISSRLDGLLYKLRRRVCLVWLVCNACLCLGKGLCKLNILFGDGTRWWM